MVYVCIAEPGFPNGANAGRPSPIKIRDANVNKIPEFQTMTDEEIATISEMVAAPAAGRANRPGLINEAIIALRYYGVHVSLVADLEALVAAQAAAPAAQVAEPDPMSTYEVYARGVNDGRNGMHWPCAGEQPAMYQQIHRHLENPKWEECDKATYNRYISYHRQYGGTPPVRALYAAAPAVVVDEANPYSDATVYAVQSKLADHGYIVPVRVVSSALTAAMEGKAS